MNAIAKCSFLTKYYTFMRRLIFVLISYHLSISIFAQPSLSTRNWFAGAQAGCNFAVADNITDHSVIKYLSDAIGTSGGVYAGKFFTPSLGCRASVSFSHVKNRGDVEYVSTEDFQNSFKGNGYYSFDSYEIGADALFDFTSMSKAHADNSFHVMGFAGIGLWHTSAKSLKVRDRVTIPPEEAIAVIAGIGSKTSVSCRLGVIADYRASNRLSFNIEGNVSIMGDTFDGIDYDEPVDFLIRAQIGTTYYF